MKKNISTVKPIKVTLDEKKIKLSFWPSAHDAIYHMVPPRLVILYLERPLVVILDSVTIEYSNTLNVN